MTKQEKLDVTVEAFEAVLEQRKLRSAYLINFGKSYQISNLEKIYTLWKEWTLHTPPYQWVASAFIWEGTPERHCAWRNLDYTWLIWVSENLNK